MTHDVTLSGHTRRRVVPRQLIDGHGRRPRHRGGGVAVQMTPGVVRQQTGVNDGNLGRQVH